LSERNKEEEMRKSRNTSVIKMSAKKTMIRKNLSKGSGNRERWTYRIRGGRRARRKGLGV